MTYTRALTMQTSFVFYEIWENREGLDLHFQQPYIREFEQLANEKLAEKPEVFMTRKIEK